MREAFTFEDGGRTYTCRVEASRASRAEAWWWFGVSGDAQRYAPFRAEAGDTEDAVRSRIVSYYGDLIERRAQPAAPRGHWHRRGNGASAGPADSSAVAAESGEPAVGGGGSAEP